jgi:imidazole glycerol-phosphate synthase subunit HisF
MERREVDELVILDIAATPNNRGPRFEEVRELTANLFMPVTIGGGVKNVSDIRRLLANGADKVALNTVACDRPSIIGDAARHFGSQAVVVSIDVHDERVVCACGRQETSRHPIDWAIEVEDRGAGEILLTSIDRDGTMDGYDIDLIREVADAVDIPVIACGGCGSYEHIAEVLYSTKAHAVGVGAAFQFKELTPKGASRYLHDQGFQVRL